MDGLKPGRIVYYRDEHGETHPSMVTRVHNEEGLINLGSIIDGGSMVWPHSSVPYDETGQKGHSWTWMYQGQALRGEAK